MKWCTKVLLAKKPSPGDVQTALPHGYERLQLDEHEHPLKLALLPLVDEAAVLLEKRL